MRIAEAVERLDSLWCAVVACALGHAQGGESSELSGGVHGLQAQSFPGARCPQHDAGMQDACTATAAHLWR